FQVSITCITTTKLKMSEVSDDQDGTEGTESLNLKPPEPSTFDCPFCAKVLKTKQGLQGHILHLHTDKPARRKRGARAKSVAQKDKGRKKSDNIPDINQASTSAGSACSSKTFTAWSSLNLMLPSRETEEDSTSSSDKDSNEDVSKDLNIPSQENMSVETSTALTHEDGDKSGDDALLKVLHIIPQTDMDDFYTSIVNQTAMSANDTLEDQEHQDTSDTESNVEDADDAPEEDLMEEDPYVLDDDIVKGMAVLKMALPAEELSETLYYYLLLLLPKEWKIDITKDKCLRIFYHSPYENVAVTRAITWKNGEIGIFIHNKPLPKSCYLWDAVKFIDSVENIGAVADHLFRVAKLIQHSTLCQGIKIYNKYWKEAEAESHGRVESIYEEDDCFRCTHCSLVVLENSTCKTCQQFKNNLKNKQHRSVKKSKDPSSTEKFNKNINLSKEELVMKAADLQKKVKNQARQIDKLKLKVARYVSSTSVNINQNLSDDLAKIFQDNHGSLTQVQKLFWSEQLKALSKKSKPRTMRWNPFVIKIALHLQTVSRSPYKYLQNFITLPSERTLYDFTHVVEAKEGPIEYVIKDLKDQLDKRTRQEHEEFFNLQFDEVSIRSDIVISKSTGEVVGYTNLSTVESELAELEANVSKSSFLNKPATKVLMYMAQGVSTEIIGIVGAYSTDTLTANQLYSRTWNIIYRLESSGLKVLSLICDGAAMNKKFMKMNSAWDTNQNFVHATENLASCDERRAIYFIIDPPHILKTVRNCLANSHSHKNSRKMYKNNEEMSWKAIEALFEATKHETFRSTKLKRAHVQLTSYGCMKVIFATQVFSASVAKSLQNFKDDPRFADYDLNELCTFIKLMNDAFDCWNSYADEKGKRNKWNPLLAPYYDITDSRFNFLKEEFLNYFYDWEQDILNRPGKFSKQKRERMFISFQSFESLKISVYGFCGAIHYMLKEKKAPFITGRKFNQDKLEQYFGVMRMSEGGNHNPNLQRVKQGIIDRHNISSAAIPARKGNTETSMEWLPDEKVIPKKIRRKDTK
ncbi:Transposable element P transposase, partial [Frankliniella fusca]